MSRPASVVCAWILSAIAVSSTTPQVGAEEKYWIAREADLVVIGTVHQGATFPWIDGWHVSGTVEIAETLYGPRVPRVIEYRFLCRWNALCRSWPPPRFARISPPRGIWFLRSSDHQTWRPAGNGGADPGFRPLSQRQDFENYLRQYRMGSDPKR